MPPSSAVEKARPPGSEAERRAALDVAAELRAAGRTADVEPAFCWPRADLTYALHAAVTVVGSVVAVSSATAGGAIVLAALVATFLDTRGILTTRRLLGRRATQNVVSPPGAAGVPAPAGPATAAVVLVAHLDTPRGGFAFGRRLRLPVLLTAMAAVFACCVVRVGTDADSTAFTAIQFALTLIVIAAGALHLDAALAPSRRAGLEGPRRAIELSAEHPRVTVLVAGAATCGDRGLRAFRRRHKGDLAQDARYVDAADADAGDRLSERPV